MVINWRVSTNKDSVALPNASLISNSSAVIVADDHLGEVLDNLVVIV